MASKPEDGEFILLRAIASTWLFLIVLYARLGPD